MKYHFSITKRTRDANVVYKGFMFDEKYSMMSDNNLNRQNI